MGRVYKALTLSNNGKSAEVVAFVDTGSDSCVISEKIANYLQIEVVDKEEIVVANREIILTGVGKVVVQSKIDDIKSEYIVNITDIPFEMDSDENIDMIIGVDFLQKNNVKLIFKEGKRRQN